ncbi:inositol monophosphatase [Paenibacillus athensensis]|uniref:Inositol-1-monophosphatase n=1 Tax=Paenibacillus athensensis TaxID=1967502 RepID=A0A4Y8PWA3_9BACL|nr:inositol monophosphatase family protein [Paenibacillus athensensis]MCD1258769.1 inositol monophosphatase [Paenibacillus athensensis]
MANGTQEPFVVGSKSFTAVAINTAAKAGEWIKSKLGDVQSIGVKSSAQDLVTEVDKGTEKLIRNLILTHFPQHMVLGEEGVEPGPAASAKAVRDAADAEYLWIVDPLDGTTNFVHGFPFFSVSIALAHKGEVIVGVVYDPIRDELFVGEKGKGAYVRGRKTVVSSELSLAESIVAGGFPPDREGALPLNLKGLQAVAPKVRGIRMGGSAALHLAYVAAGRLSGYWEIGLNAWDIAAGALLVQESGGRVTGTAGEPFGLEVRNLLATNGGIHDELQATLEQAGATGL